MKPLDQWPESQRNLIRGVFTDIDDTLTTHGTITPDALQALAALRAAGKTVIAITGRHVGYCEALLNDNMPVDAIVGENGALALLSTPNGLKKLHQQSLAELETNQARMKSAAQKVLSEVPEIKLAADIGGRDTDLAFDYNEHVHLSQSVVDKVVAILQAEGMHTSVSSIHIHGCFDDFNKWTGACWIVKELFGRDLEKELDNWVFVGDSGNDQAMFEHFNCSVGVANIRRFESQLKFLPTYIAPSERGAGFAQVAAALL